MSLIIYNKVWSAFFKVLQIVFIFGWNLRKMNDFDK